MRARIKQNSYYSRIEERIKSSQFCSLDHVLNVYWSNYFGRMKVDKSYRQIRFHLTASNDQLDRETCFYSRL